MQGLLRSQDFWLLDLASMKSRPLTRLQNRATMRTFDVTSDGKEIVFDRLRENSQVVMIDLPREQRYSTTISGPLPGLDLLPHGLQIPLHAVDSDREDVHEA